MTHSKPITARYSPLDQKEGEVEIVEYPASRRSRTRFLTTILIVVVICSLCGYVLGARFPIRFQKKTSSSHNCVEPAVRREWRSLSSSEKQDYISAVQCLRSTPSRLNASQSLYDDFPYVHAVVGGFSHGAAAFLSWHRAFLHIFEQALEEECQYAGNLVYWDWTLDWTNLTAAPVWAEEDGFGGNGNRSATSGDPIRSGYCVSDGPFADLQVLYYGPFYRPHCLSRGFEHGRKLDRDSTRVKPEMIESLMKCNDYESFNLQLEDGPHMSIPRTVNGDFALFTAPYDPVFLLHHTQLDRLWWRWQNIDWDNRGGQYAGLAAMNSTDRAAITDILPMGGLAPDLKVTEMLSTEGTRLCYRY